MEVPAQILACCVDDGIAYGGEICRDVMLETVLANVSQQFLHLGNFDDTSATVIAGPERLRFSFALGHSVDPDGRAVLGSDSWSVWLSDRQPLADSWLTRILPARRGGKALRALVRWLSVPAR